MNGNGKNLQTVSQKKDTKKARPIFSLEDLKVRSMLLEQTMELISEFHTLKLESQSLDVSVRTTKDPDYFTLTKSKYEINKCYLDLISKSLNKNGGHFDTDVIIDNDKANYRVTKGSIQRLEPGKWLNDEIVNAYVSLINDREKQLNLGSVFTFNTYFYTMLEGMFQRGDYDYKKLERVLTRKKVNLKNYKMVLLPINI